METEITKDTQISNQSADAELIELDPKYSITQSELAPLMGVTTQYLGTWLKQNKIPVKKVGKLHYLPFEGTRKFVLSRINNFPGQVIPVQMLKGGGTKTTTVYNVGIRLVHFGARVLLIDTDPQGNLTNSVLPDGKKTEDLPKIIDLVIEGASAESLVQKVAPGLDLIPSDFDNSSLDLHLGSRTNLEAWFKGKIIDPLRAKYDFILIDCNPSLSAINLSIAMAADMIIIPVNPSEYSYSGLKKTLEEYANIEQDYLKGKRKINYKLLFTLFDQRATSSHHFLTQYATQYQDKMLSDYIRRTNDIENSLMLRKTAFDLKKSFAREDYDALTRSLIGVRNLEKREGEIRA